MKQTTLFGTLPGYADEADAGHPPEQANAKADTGHPLEQANAKADTGHPPEQANAKADAGHPPEQANAKADTGHPPSRILPHNKQCAVPVTPNFAALENNWIELDLPDASIRYLPGFLAGAEADDYLDALKNELMWRQDEVTIYGKTFLTPRLQAWYGDPESGYHYSGMSLHPLSWTINLLTLKRRCEAAVGTQFNSVLGNWYRNGNDSMGMHADDEAELGKTPTIAALSFGESRPLKFRHKKGLGKVDLPLPHGSLMVMSGQTQGYWLHGISKTKKPVNERISLTFRQIFPHSV